MQLSDFDYDLPPELIAHYPLAKRSASRLLCVDGTTGHIEHQFFPHILDLLNKDDLLVLNDTRVIPARLLGHKQTGGQIEVMIERILDSHRLIAKVRASKAPKTGTKLLFSSNVQFEVLGRQEEFFELQCLDSRPVLEVIESIGQIPLPPYISRTPVDSDLERYQTIFARYKGSVAAPTAGLHFDEAIFKQLQDKGVRIAFLTLHVGAGTYAPVRTDNILEHQMHAEYLEVSESLCQEVKAAKKRGNRVVAVGTTSVRGLETASSNGEIAPYSGETTIFIYPGYIFRTVDALITNLHLPGSTLLMLVSALGGYENLMRAYKEAVAEKYRFFSYGDAMWISKK